MSNTTDTGSIPKKDLTSILDLEPNSENLNSSEESSEPQVLETQNIESVDDFPALESEPYVEESVNEPENETRESLPAESSIPENTEEATFEPITEPITETIHEPIPEKNNFSNLREFAEKLPIGNPIIEANPPYSLFATGSFNEKQKDEILAIINDLQLGILSRDLTIQLEMGRLLIPQISEYVAIMIAQKIKDLCTEVRIGPSSKIYQN